MSVLRISVRLAAPVVAAEELHLDSMFLGMSLGLHLTRTDDITTLGNIPMPIVQRSYGGHTIAFCSAASWPADARLTREYFTKRKDGTDVEMLARPFRGGSGPGKNYHLPAMTIESESMWWHAVGRRSGVLDILRHVRTIGGLRKQGFGKVVPDSWVVDVIEQPPSSVLVASGTAQRHLPAAWCSWAARHDEGSVAFPYWHPQRRTVRVPRGTKALLKPELEALVRAIIR